MRLVKMDTTHHSHARLQCVKCGNWCLPRHLHADLDGKPFVDYYCNLCVFAESEMHEHVVKPEEVTA